MYISEHLSLLKVCSGVGVARSVLKIFCSSVVYISEYLSLLKVCSGVGVARSVVFCVVLCISLST